jgi:hypothetical protein
MKTFREMEWSPYILNLCIKWEWSASRFGLLYFRGAHRPPAVRVYTVCCSPQSKPVFQLNSNHFTGGAIATHINKSLVRFIVCDVHSVSTGIRNCGSRPLKTVKWKKGSQGGHNQWDCLNDVLTPICESQGGDVLNITPGGALRQLCKRYSVPKCTASVYIPPPQLVNEPQNDTHCAAKSYCTEQL